MDLLWATSDLETILWKYILLDKISARMFFQYWIVRYLNLSEEIRLKVAYNAVHMEIESYL